jgi:hypothetical protein
MWVWLYLGGIGLQCTQTNFVGNPQPTVVNTLSVIDKVIVRLFYTGDMN